MELDSEDTQVPRGNPPVTTDRIGAIVERAFGGDRRLTEVHPMRGGTFNRIYLLHFAAHPSLVLRVAPSPDSPHLSWDDAYLMRREYAIQPYLAPLSPRIPRIVLADFTHDVLDRDYMIQTFLPGECWEDVAETGEGRLALWSQFGAVLRTLHQVTGEGFGTPYLRPLFPTWSDAILHRLGRIRLAMQEADLDTSGLETVQAIAAANASRLNIVRRPALLHGDLWLFNLLVSRTGPDGTPAIVGVLDADRCWWGDPAADWTMFLLRLSAGEETEADYSAFWREYGPLETGDEAEPDTAFRMQLYEALHIATSWTWAASNGNHEMRERGRTDMERALERLKAY